jgi:hypothetical protein
VARALEELEDKRATEALIMALDDEEEEVRPRTFPGTRDRTVKRPHLTKPLLVSLRIENDQSQRMNNILST